jgi:hypothetical protein
MASCATRARALRVRIGGWLRLGKEISGHAVRAARLLPYIADGRKTPGHLNIRGQVGRASTSRATSTYANGPLCGQGSEARGLPRGRRGPRCAHARKLGRWKLPQSSSTQDPRTSASDPTELRLERSKCCQRIAASTGGLKVNSNRRRRPSWLLPQDYSARTVYRPPAGIGASTGSVSYSPPWAWALGTP